jgi:hypothetical protein
MNEVFRNYPIVMLSFGICLLMFFACIVASVNECDNSCTTTNRDLNKTGLSFGIIGILVAFSISLYSGMIIRFS